MFTSTSASEIAIYGFQEDLLFPANVYMRLESGRAGCNSWLCRAACIPPSIPAEGMVPFQPLRGIRSCLVSPKALQVAFRRVEEIPAPGPDVCLDLGACGRGEVDPNPMLLPDPRPSQLVKSALERFLLLKSGVRYATDISKDLGAAGT